jgi:threonyl-tRNA synthetase
MKLLCLHAERFGYTFDHRTIGGERHAVGAHSEFEDALVVFVAVEPGDATKVNHAAKEVRHAARRARAARVVVNPFVHLTDAPASSDEAAEVSKALGARLEESFEGEVAYTSFGWYKAFRIDVRGDEHSQIFRHV